MGRLARALLAALVVLTTSAPAALASAAPPRLRISVTPQTIAVGSAAQVCVRSQVGELVAVSAATPLSGPSRVVRTGRAAGTLTCWAVRPAADTRLVASVVGGPSSRTSAPIVLRVRRPASGCSATAPLFDDADSAQCLYRAAVRGDRATALRYAVPAVVGQLWEWRRAGGLRWQWGRCGEPVLLSPSSGTSCLYYEPAPPGAVHGVTIEFGMSRSHRVEAVGTVG